MNLGEKCVGINRWGKNIYSNIWGTCVASNLFPAKGVVGVHELCPGYRLARYICQSSAGTSMHSPDPAFHRFEAKFYGGCVRFIF